MWTEHSWISISIYIYIWIRLGSNYLSEVCLFKLVLFSFYQILLPFRLVWEKEKKSDF